MTKLSVNINKIATLRNSRGGDIPSLPWAIDEIARARAHGITIHPRADERHITRRDIFEVAEYLRNRYPHLELNIEGDVRRDLIEAIIEVKPTQATLVPVRPGEITSDRGFDFDHLPEGIEECIALYKRHGIRVSLFIFARPEDPMRAKEIGADRIEIYTGPYAMANPSQKKEELAKIKETIEAAREVGLGVNAGHDLDLENLPALLQAGPIDEVSIGHRLISHALGVGLYRAVVDFLTVIEKNTEFHTIKDEGSRNP